MDLGQETDAELPPLSMRLHPSMRLHHTHLATVPVPGCCGRAGSVLSHASILHNGLGAIGVTTVSWERLLWLPRRGKDNRTQLFYCWSEFCKFIFFNLASFKYNFCLFVWKAEVNRGEIPHVLPSLTHSRGGRTRQKAGARSCTRVCDTCGRYPQFGAIITCHHPRCVSAGSQSFGVHTQGVPKSILSTVQDACA